jgi:hypothetical protein
MKGGVRANKTWPILLNESNMKPHRQLYVFVPTIFLILIILPVSTLAESFIPSSDSIVVEHLPKQHRLFASLLSTRITSSNETSGSMEQDSIAQISIRNSLNETIEHAYQNLELARQYADPRFYGYTEALIAPWLITSGSSNDKPPLKILLVQAIIEQAKHNFNDALTLLDTILTEDPGNSQALLTRASLLQVMGKYAQASQDCKALVGTIPNSISFPCIASVASMNGQLAKSYSLLKKIAEHTTGSLTTVDTSQKRWLLVLLGDMADRLGDTRASQSYLMAATHCLCADSYANEAYADFLIQQKEYIKMIDFSNQVAPTIGMMVRQNLAYSQINDPKASIVAKKIGNLFFQAKSRKGIQHYREQAYYALYVEKNMTNALVLSKINWQRQKEPLDFRLYLQAALHTKSTTDINLITRWMQINKLEDVHLDTLLEHSTRVIP